jgi:hypothetical protein
MSMPVVYRKPTGVIGHEEPFIPPPLAAPERLPLAREKSFRPRSLPSLTTATQEYTAGAQIFARRS